jgi:hypothetical protein
VARRPVDVFPGGCVSRIHFTFVSHFPSREAEALRGVVDAMDLQPAIFDAIRRHGR